MLNLDAIRCPKCGSTQVRSYDNTTFYHPSAQDVKEGISKIDNEVVMDMNCDSCDYKFTTRFELRLIR